MMKTKREVRTGIIRIQDGLLLAYESGKDRKPVFRAKASAKSAVALGKELRKMDAAGETIHWMYSSSVDFPTEDGAPDLDFRSLIEQGE